jgi:hypothetical protein
MSVSEIWWIFLRVMSSSSYEEVLATKVSDKDVTVVEAISSTACTRLLRFSSVLDTVYVQTNLLSDLH